MQKEKSPKEYCYLALKDLPCVKNKVKKTHLPHYEYEKCIWRIPSHNSRTLKSLEKLFQKYGGQTWD